MASLNLRILLCVSFAWTAPAATVMLQDGTFSNSDWTATTYFQSGSVSGTGAQVVSGGNPGAYRQLTFSWPQIASPSNHTTFVANFGALVFNPSLSGEILSLQIEYDLARISGSANFTDTGGYRPVLLQGGNMFILTTGAQSLANNVNWTPHSVTSLSPLDWSPITGFGSGQPDFSGSGAAITFGYRVSMGVNCPGGFTHCFAESVASGLDNFKVTITTADSRSDVPEPSTAAMAALSAGLAALGSRLRRGFPHQRQTP